MSDHDIPIDINILLHGYDCLSLAENISYFDQVHQFIKNRKNILKCKLTMSNTVLNVLYIY